MTVFIGVYKAIYSYEPQTPEELAIEEDDLLYLLEKSDVDDWWTVKKRVLGTDAEEPTGLVPSNYIGEAPVLSTIKALYDYDTVQNPDEELAFHEGDLFDVYDDRDQDWYLVKSHKGEEYGFVPGNYCEVANGVSTPAVAAPPTVVDVSTLPPPPQHSDRQKITESEEEEQRQQKSSHRQPEEEREEEEDDVPPVMPARPTSTIQSEPDDMPPVKPTRPRGNTGSSSRTRIMEDDTYEDDAQDSYDMDMHTWNVSEIEGRKKRKAKLSIGQKKIFYIPQKGSPQDWTIDKLISYDNEKKHMFLEFVDPYKNLELHTGNNDTCNEIMAIISEIKGASRDRGIKEVEIASQKPKKKGTVTYDFQAESLDELTVKTGQTVYIINDKKSKDWWMCELIDSGKRGVVPAQFIDPINDNSKLHSPSSSTKLMSSLKKFAGYSSPHSKPGSWKDDETQNRTSRSRSGSSARRKSTASSKEFPNFKKTRIWADKTATFKVEAQFIGFKDGKIHLHKANGVKIAVPAEKLSYDDIVYVERATGYSLDKYKSRQQQVNNENSSSRDLEEREKDRRLRQRELEELKRARDLLDQERARLREEKTSSSLPPTKPPRPHSSASTSSKKQDYDWFEFFLNSGVDVSNCQRYTLNFDRERITEDMMGDINESMLRTLGLREGDIVRVMKYLDTKFGRNVGTTTGTATAGMFSEPDGSLKNNQEQGVQQGDKLLSQSTAPVAAAHADDAWTIKPAAKSETNLMTENTEFTGSMKDLLDLKPLEPKKAEPKPATSPEPNLQSLEPVNTGAKPIVIDKTGSTLVPLDPFKTGGNNVLPMATGFVMMPVATGGLLPLQRTGGMPQTTFGTLQRTGGTNLMPVALTGGAIPQTTFAAQTTGGQGLISLQRTGGMAPMPLQITGNNMLPQTTFNMPPPGSVLPIQKTATGLIPMNSTGGVMQGPQTTFGVQNTGMMQQTNFTAQITGGANMLPQTTFNNAAMNNGMNMLPQTTFGTQLTGNAAIQQQAGFNNQFTGGPQTSFNAPNMTGGFQQAPMNNQMTSGFQPKSQFGMTLQRTGGMGQAMTSFNTTGGPMQNSPMPQQPLQTQPTGFGFGNGPQQQPMQANLYNATASNPFGF